MKKIHIYLDGWTEAEEFVINDDNPVIIMRCFKEFLCRFWDMIIG